MMFRCRHMVVVLFVVLAVPLCAQRSATANRSANPWAAELREIDPALRQLLMTTPAVDNHAHPVLAPPAMASDREFDALPVDNMEPQTDPVAWRPDFPALAAAWQALWGFTDQPPLAAAQATALEAARQRVRSREGEHYADWVLDQATIGTMLANRVAMGTGVQPPRFRWVPYDDALLFPLDNSALAAATPDRSAFFPLEDKLRARYLHDAGVQQLPPSLEGYLRQVVTPTLERQKAGGAVAIKFEVAYLRSFGFEDVPETEAAAVYARFADGRTAPPAADYKRLQDFLFRFLAHEAGRLGMAVHLHGMAGAGRYFSQAGVNPMLLEPLLNDQQLKGTNFVLLHGGWPYVREAGALLQKPNFYLDLSQEAFLFPARTLASWLREWIETYPEKVLFGTDGYPYSSALGWEESSWIASRNARVALGLALTGMLHDGEISPERARAIAVQVLRGNAASLYKLPSR